LERIDDNSGLFSQMSIIIIIIISLGPSSVLFNSHSVFNFEV